MAEENQQQTQQTQQQSQQTQQQTAAWYEGLDAETIGAWDNKGWKKDDPKALAGELTKAWKGLEKHFGVPADRLVKLPKDATDEAGWAELRQRLGAPKESKEYDFTGIKYVDGSELEPSFADMMRGSLHKAGTEKNAASQIVKDVVSWLGNADKAETEERSARLTLERTELLKEWGPNADFNRLTAMQGAKRAAGSDEGGKKLVDAMQDAIGYKATMEFFRKIGAGTTEDTFQDNHGGGGGQPTTRAGAIARRAELESDPAWVKRYTAGGVAEKREMDALLLHIAGEAA